MNAQTNSKTIWKAYESMAWFAKPVKASNGWGADGSRTTRLAMSDNRDLWGRLKPRD